MSKPGPHSHLCHPQTSSNSLMMQIHRVQEEPQLMDVQQILETLTDAFSLLQSRLVHLEIQMPRAYRHLGPLLKSMQDHAHVQNQLKMHLYLTLQLKAQVYGMVYTQRKMQQLLAQMRAQAQLHVQLHTQLARGQQMLAQAKVHDEHETQHAANVVQTLLDVDTVARSYAGGGASAASACSSAARAATSVSQADASPRAQGSVDAPPKKKRRVTWAEGTKSAA